MAVSPRARAFLSRNRRLIENSLASMRFKGRYLRKMKFHSTLSREKNNFEENKRNQQYFLKISDQKQSIKFILKNSCGNCLDLNSCSRLESRHKKSGILVLVSNHETERKKFSFSSRKLRYASRHALLSAVALPGFAFASSFCLCFNFCQQLLLC